MRQPLDVEVGVGVRQRPEPRLEVGERGRGAGLAHVVVAAAGGAGLLDGQLVEEVARARRPGQLLIHDASPVMSVRPLEHEDGGRRPTLVPGHPDAAGMAERAGHELELPAGVEAVSAQAGQETRLVLLRRPAFEQALEELVENRHEPPRRIALDLEPGPLGRADGAPRTLREKLHPDSVEPSVERQQMGEAGDGDGPPRQRHTPCLRIERVGAQRGPEDATSSQVRGGDDRVRESDALRCDEPAQAPRRRERGLDAPAADHRHDQHPSARQLIEATGVLVAAGPADEIDPPGRMADERARVGGEDGLPFGAWRWRHHTAGHVPRGPGGAAVRRHLARNHVVSVAGTLRCRERQSTPGRVSKSVTATVDSARSQARPTLAIPSTFRSTTPRISTSPQSAPSRITSADVRRCTRQTLLYRKFTTCGTVASARNASVPAPWSAYSLPNSRRTSGAAKAKPSATGTTIPAVWASTLRA